jgi:hypothetical protein
VLGLSEPIEDGTMFLRQGSLTGDEFSHEYFTGLCCNTQLDYIPIEIKTEFNELIHFDVYSLKFRLN